MQISAKIVWLPLKLALDHNLMQKIQHKILEYKTDFELKKGEKLNDDDRRLKTTIYGLKF